MRTHRTWGQKAGCRLSVGTSPLLWGSPSSCVPGHDKLSWSPPCRQQSGLHLVTAGTTQHCPWPGLPAGGPQAAQESWGWGGRGAGERAPSTLRAPVLASGGRGGHARGHQRRPAAVHTWAAAVSGAPRRRGAAIPGGGSPANPRALPPLDARGRALLLPGGAAAGRVQEVNFRGAHWHFPGGIIILPFLESAQEGPAPANFEVAPLRAVPLRRWACPRPYAPRRSP